MDTEEAARPERTVTVDQIVAYNIRHWRREAGLTQAELGERLGWTAANVSAAERSADHARDRRRFDAGTLAALSLALGVPLTALFLPPEDDGAEARYVFAGPAAARDIRDGITGERPHDMSEFMELVVMPDSDEESPVMDAYRVRFRADGEQYLAPEWATELAGWLRLAAPEEIRADRIAGLLGDSSDLERVAGRLRDLARALGRLTP